MIWVSWRQQRTETLIARRSSPCSRRTHPDRDHMTALQPRRPFRSVPRQVSARAPAAGDRRLHRALRVSSATSTAWFTLVPGLIGVLLAAPFIHELENGTYRLAWTQSITRGRWLAGKLGLAIGTAFVAAFAIDVLITWWRGPFVHLHGRMETSVFDFEGIVVFAYVLFALGLALAVGAVWRRTVPALVVGFAGYTAARIFVQGWLRQRYEAPLTSTWPDGRVPGPP